MSVAPSKAIRPFLPGKVALAGSARVSKIPTAAATASDTSLFFDLMSLLLSMRAVSFFFPKLSGALQTATLWAVSTMAGK
jgi:hypothetical protein